MRARCVSKTNHGGVLSHTELRQALNNGIPFLSPWLGLAAGIPTPEEVPEAYSRKAFGAQSVIDCYDF